MFWQTMITLQYLDVSVGRWYKGYGECVLFKTSKLEKTDDLYYNTASICGNVSCVLFQTKIYSCS